MILILFIAAFLGSVVFFAVSLIVAPTMAPLAAMFGGAGAIALAVVWMSYVQRRRAQGGAVPHTTPAKADWASPH